MRRLSLVCALVVLAPTAAWGQISLGDANGPAVLPSLSDSFRSRLDRPLEPLLNDCEPLENSTGGSVILVQQGCCSHHNGVRGCSGGRTFCCDGTLSPSCTCSSPSPAPAPSTP